MSGQSNNNSGQTELAQQGLSQSRVNTGFQEDEIDLLNLLLTVLRHKRMILTVTLLTGVLAAGVSLLKTNIYRAEVLMVPVQGDDGKRGGMGAVLGGLGGLASLAGVSMGSGGSSEENLAVLKSRDFLWRFVQDKKLMPILFEDAWDEQQKKWKETEPKKQPGQMDAYRFFNGVLEVNKDKKSGLITVAVEWKDAALATEWANSLVERLNQYLAQQAIARSEQNLKYLNEELMRIQVEEMRKTLFDLIATEQKNVMLANTQKEFAFKVLDPAVEPDRKVKPKRSQIVIMAMLAAFLLAVIWVFVSEAMQRFREQPEQAERWAELRRALGFKI